jgi:hypothetical protein
MTGGRLANTLPESSPMADGNQLPARISVAQTTFQNHNPTCLINSTLIFPTIKYVHNISNIGVSPI